MSSDQRGLDLSQLERACRDLAPHLTNGALVVGRSTVPVGTASSIANLMNELVADDGESVEVAWHPEFLRQGHAVADSARPSRLVFGVASDAARSTLLKVYAAQVAAGVPVVVTSLASAEPAKLAANAMISTRISFMNAVAEIAEVTAADIGDVSAVLALDDRLGSGALEAGLGFGGGRLPKDLRSFSEQAADLGLGGPARFLAQVDEINADQMPRIVALAERASGGSLKGRRVAVWGTAYKPGTDDLSESPAMGVAVELLTRGADVVVYDPRAGAAAALACPALRHAEGAIEAATGADLVLVLTGWPEFAALDPLVVSEVVRSRVIVDGRVSLDPGRWRRAGWQVHALGR